MEIFSFGLNVPHTETSAEVLGGKGAGLVWMDSIGVNVPPGLIIPTTTYQAYKSAPKSTMKQIAKDIEPWMQRLKAKFGYMPLVSVRSGARVSCPGMMDTILNVGLDDASEAFWREKLGEKAYLNSLDRLITMYGTVVKDIDKEGFSLAGESLASYYQGVTGEPFPKAQGQLLGSIEAVFKSWDNDRCKVYRKLNNIPDDWGTAVTVQAMVFGNLNDESGTGVLFSRDTSSGENKVVGEYLMNAQGEDVVAGTSTPLSIEEMGIANNHLYNQLVGIAQLLENRKKDVQDIEFTIQDGELFILQTRTAKRSARAAVKIAVDMYDSLFIDFDTMCGRVTMKQLDQCNEVQIDSSYTESPTFKGIPACTGVVGGVVLTDKKFAIDCKTPFILVSQETTPEDIAAMNQAAGILTMTGGSTSHAALVARGMNKPCVVGLSVNIEKFKNGQYITINGATGEVWLDKVPLVSSADSFELNRFREICLDKAQIQYTVGAIATDQGMFSYKVIDLASRLYEKDIYETISNVSAFSTCVYLNCMTQNASETMLFDIFGHSEDEMNKMLCRLSNAPFASKLVVFTSMDKAEWTLPSIAVTTGSLESLVMCEGSMFFSGDLSPAAKKVMEWKAKESDMMMFQDGVLSNSVHALISENQILAQLLK